MNVIGTVSSLSGTAVAIKADGTERQLMLADEIYADEMVKVSLDSAIEIAMEGGDPVRLDGGQNWLASSETFTEAEDFDLSEAVTDSESIEEAVASTSETNSDIDAIQAAILAGQDPTEVAEATAAGAGGDGAGGNEGSSFVQISATRAEVDPTAGFNTQGFSDPATRTIQDEGIFDDIPKVGATTVFLDEDDLGARKLLLEDFNELQDAFEAATGLYSSIAFAQGIGDTAEGDDLPPFSPTTASGTLNADFGANGPGNIEFNSASQQPSGLTSGGDIIQYWVSDDGQSLVGYVVREYQDGPFNPFSPVGVQRIQVEEGPSSHAEIIFTATQNGSGDYTVALFGSLDHPDTSTEDNVLINLGYTITDVDGDSVQGALTINVDDDSPVIESISEYDDGEEYPQGEGQISTLDVAEDSSGLHIIHDESRGAQSSRGDRDPADDLFTSLFPQGGPLGIDMIGAAARPVESGYFGYRGEGGFGGYYESGVRYDAGADGLQNLALTDAEGQLLVGQNSGLRTSDTGESIYLYTIPAALLTDITGGEIPEQFANMADNFVVGLTVPELDLTDIESLMERYESPEAIVGDLAFVVGLLEDVGPGYYRGPFGSDSQDDVIALMQLRAIDHPQGGSTREDHDDMVSIENLIHITITDGDGDTATSEAITVSFDDDGPRIGESRTGRVDEEGLTEGNPGDSYPQGDARGEALVATRSLKINWGADNDNDPTTGGDRSVTFDVQNAPEGLTSNGEQVSYVISDDGTVLTAYTGTLSTTDALSEDYNEVFVVTLSDVNKGSYTFELKDNLDHPRVAGDDSPQRRESQSEEESLGYEDNINLNFAFTAADADGDTASSRFTVSVDDDAPVIGEGENAPEDSIVDEEGLATAATQDDAYDGDVTGASLTAGGDLNISWGSDDNNTGTANRSVQFTDSASLPALKSNGVDVDYSISADGTVLTATAGETPVFVATLSDLESGSYTFEQFANLDHPTADTEDDIDLTFEFTATDSDGDTAASSFTVTVDDDAPVIGEALSENDGNSILLGARDGSADLSSWGVARGALVGSLTMNGVTANIEFLDNDNKANSKLKIYNNNANHIGGGSLADNDGQGINRGEQLKISFDQLMQQAEIGVDGLGNHFLPGASQQAHATWVAYKDGVKVAEGEIDNPEGQNQGAAGLLEVFTVAIPGGFDSIVLGNNSRNAGSNYEVRYVQAQAKNIVDEEGLQPQGNLGDSYSDNGDAAGASLTTSGDLNVIWGADDNNSGTANRSVTFTDIDELPELTSNDVVVQYHISEDGTVLTAYTGTHPDNVAELQEEPVDEDYSPVFVVTLSDTESGSFSFELLGNLDHPESNTEDDLDLTFGFVASDSDGDTVEGSFMVTVDDDAPVAANETVNTDEDTSITIDVMVNGSGGADGAVISSYTQPENGEIVLNEDGTFTYTPVVNLHGQESFTYTLTDGDGDTSTATVVIDVEAVADAPILIMSMSEAVVQSSPQTIHKDNAGSTGEGFTVTAYNMAGNETTISKRSGTQSDGFGVTGKNGASGANSEIGSNSRASEVLKVEFDNTVSSIDVEFAWLSRIETATYTFYLDGVAVGSGTTAFQSDKVDGVFTLSPPSGSEFDRVDFSAPLNGTDDYLVHSITFEKVESYTYDLNLSRALTDTDGSEIIGSISLDPTTFPDGVYLFDTEVNDFSGVFVDADDYTLTLVSDAPLTDAQINAITASVKSTETSNLDEAETVANAKVEFDGLDASGEAADVLIEGTNAGDNILGGQGNDILTGGDGDDHFIWTAADAVGGTDVITDFMQNGDQDVIDLSDVLDPTGVLDIGGADSIDDYLKATFDSETGTTTVEVFSGGDANSSGSVDQTIIVNGDISDLSTLLTSGNLDVDNP